MNSDYTVRKSCRLCGSNSLSECLSLRPSPLVNELTREINLDEPSDVFPLDLNVCNSCSHVQLSIVVDPERLYRNYVYVSGTSSVFRKHFNDYAESAVNWLGLRRDDLVIEIGSNDGTQLKKFSEFGMEVLGVDPAINIANEATKNGINTIPEFFNISLAEKIVNDHGHASLVIANNVMAHIDNLHEIVHGVKSLLRSSGIFSFEVNYLCDILNDGLFDTIYHEHLDYHTVTPLVKFFDSFGMTLFDVERIPTHGGSIRCFVCNNTDRSVTKRVFDLVRAEQDFVTNKDTIFKQFSDSIEKLRIRLNDEFDRIRQQDPLKQMVVYGASAKAIGLINQFGLNNDMIKFIVDDNPLKQGLYTPGSMIKIVSSDCLYENYGNDGHDVLVLAWNFADSIINNHRKCIDNGGSFIIPLPDFVVITEPGM